MPSKNEAYKSIMGELKDRIRSYGSERMHKSKSGHEEPDGDESASGDEYPGSPDDMTDTENANVAQEGSPCSICGGKIDSQGNCPSCEP
jgi:hypothetical protein